MATPKKILPKDKASNQGDLAEAVLGAAIVAKITMRLSNGTIGRVSKNEVRKVLDIMRRAPLSPNGVTKTQIKVDIGGSAKDKVTFFLNLGKVMMKELQGFKNLAVLDRLCDAAASYVNAPRMEALAAEMYQNNINNKLEIDVDGISNNKETKADLVVKTDKFVFDRISLKAGPKKSGAILGQVGGNTWGSILRLFNEGVNQKTKRKEIGLGLKLNSPANETKYMRMLTEKPTFDTVDKAVRFAYKLAQDAFNLLSKSMAAKQVTKFLQFQSGRNDTDVKIVMLRLGKHKTLNPMLLETALTTVKLKAVMRLDTKWPILLVYDAKTPAPTSVYSANTVFAVRPRIDPRTIGYITHIVEEGPKFSELILESASEEFKIKWKAPTARDEMAEIARTAEVYGVTAKDILQVFTKGMLITLTDPYWMKLENTDSWETTDLDSVRALCKKTGGNPDPIIKGFTIGEAIPAPVIIAVDNEPPYLVGGNTRLMVARAIETQPKIWLVRLKRK